MKCKERHKNVLINFKRRFPFTAKTGFTGRRVLTRPQCFGVGGGSLLGSFLLLFCVRPNMLQELPPEPSRRPKTPPRSSQEAPKTPPRRPKTPQEAPRGSQELFLDRFGVPFWDVLGSRINPKSLLDASSLPKRYFSQNISPTNEF